MMNSRIRKTNERSIKIKNDMDVWGDDYDKSINTSSLTIGRITRSTVESTFNTSTYTKSVNSDSDSDFDLTQSSIKTSVSSKSPTKRISKLLKNGKSKHDAQVKRLMKKKTSNSTATTTLSEVDKSVKSTSENITPSNNEKINNIKVDTVNIAISSTIKKSQNIDVQKKKQVVRNIFNTSRTKENIGTQTDKVSQNSKEISSTTCNSRRSVQVQTAQENLIVNTTSTTCITPLKRPHNMATQTDEKQVEPVKKKITKMQLNSPNRLQTIREGSPLRQVTEERQNRMEAEKLNLTDSLNKTPTFNKNIENELENIASSRKNKVSTTPMKQLTITESFGNKDDNRLRIISTPRSSPSKSPMKESPPKKSPVKNSPLKNSPLKNSPLKNSPLKNSAEKKETRYSLESHNRLYENVKKIINWVFNNPHFSILFTKAETDLMKKLLNFQDKNVAIMCLRLYTRQHKWYNFKTLCEDLNLYFRNTNLKEFYTNLTNGFVCSDYSNEKIEDLLDYMILPDVKAICNSFKIRVGSRKKVLINKLLEYSKTQCTLSSLKDAKQILMDHVKKKLGICIKMEMNIRDLLFRIHLLYSLCNPELETANDIYNLMYRIQNEFVKYPVVKHDSANIFSTRQDFLKYSEAMILKTEFYEQYEKKNISSAYFLCAEAFNRLKKLLSDKSQIRFHKSKPLFLRRFSAAWVYCKVLQFGSQHLGKDYTDNVCEWLQEMLKQTVYCTNNRGHWYLQLAVVTKTYKKDIVRETQIIIDGLSDKYVSEVHKHELSIRGSKIKKAKISQLLYDQLQCVILPNIDVPVVRLIQANVVHNNERGKKLLFVRTTDDGKEYSSVEQTAINYYTEEKNFTHGVHCEGQLLDALFIILFFDIIYKTHIPNTFITELQSRPLDLYSAEFYSNRSNKIKERLDAIRDTTVDELCEYATEVYTENAEELKSISNFDFVREDTFQVIIKCIGNNILASILERFAKDYKQFHSGLPDLFLWNTRNLQCCFVEVKSEKDTLSTKQLLWINYLHSIGAKVEVCHVEHIGSTTIKKMKK